MRCRKCQYRLWGIRGRQCPECGTTFYPSRFEFVPNSVRFNCPHCDQDYYGTSESGHLVPSAFACVRCSRHIHMDEMVLFPTEGLREEQTQIERFAWLKRDQVGFVRAWLRTVLMGMFSPTRTMRLTATDGSVLQAWWFAALTAATATVAGMSLVVALAAMGRMPVSGTIVLLVTAMVSGLIWPTGLIILWGGVVHLVLTIVDGCERGPSRTYEAICYSSAPNVLLALPCLGFYLLPIAWTWWMISALFMIREGQRAGGVRAMVAVALLPGVMLAGVVAWFAYVSVPQSRILQAGRQAVAAQEANVSLITVRLIQEANTNGRPPIHAVELIDKGVPASAFASQDRPGDMYATFVAKTSLKSISEMGPERRAVLLKTIEAAMPEKPVAHRLGDFVFTYHGIDFAKGDPKLWTVVLVRPIIRGQFEVGTLDGSVSHVVPESFAEELARQNVLRAKYGLPPLPDPRKIDPKAAAVTAAPPAATRPPQR